MRLVLLIIGALALFAAGLLYVRLSGGTAVVAAARPGAGLFALTAPDLKGKPVPLSNFRGQVVLVVNVASECGLAGQYPQLETLFTRHRTEGFTVLAFPSNDFWQEPGDAATVARACELHGVTFPVFAKTGVRPGPDQSPVYAYLTSTGHVPMWNFAKYLVGRDGAVRHFFGPLVTPESPELEAAIEEALAEPGPAH